MFLIQAIFLYFYFSHLCAHFSAIDNPRRLLYFWGLQGIRLGIFDRLIILTKSYELIF